MRLLMIKNNFFPIIIALFLALLSCKEQSPVTAQELGEKAYDKKEYAKQPNEELVIGANLTATYLPYLKGKRVGIVANQTSIIFKRENQDNENTIKKSLGEAAYIHLVDSLVKLDIDVKKVLAPEHGFRGTADAGETIKNGIDSKTGVPIVSIYGSDKTLSKDKIENIDIIIFDIQDVGARFYTYISTLHYVMEACAAAKIPVLILDRPNPNGHYVDGPVLKMEHQSFVGMHPIPTVHGMTIAEYAQMINGENWLKNKSKCELIIVKMENYSRSKFYSLPVKPSPNLPNDRAVNLYPSLCFFEGTNVSAGRGTSSQFQIYGSPFLHDSIYTYNFTPKPNLGSKYPKHNGELCYGENLTNAKDLNYIRLEYLIDAYANTAEKSKFFNDYFTNLAGTKTLRKQIESGHSAEEIRASWKDDLIVFKNLRAPYLLYNH
ncbi:MAG: DUF1343 domain-containing protein [Bacteroidota bacterium]